MLCLSNFGYAVYFYLEKYTNYELMTHTFKYHTFIFIFFTLEW